jgi:hypothetical protein
LNGWAVSNPTWIQDQNLVAGLDQSKERGIYGLFGPNRHYDLSLWLIDELLLAPELCRDSLP